MPPGTHPHDVAPAPDGTVWYTAQHTGKLGTARPDDGADDGDLARRRLGAARRHRRARRRRVGDRRRAQRDRPCRSRYVRLSRLPAARLDGQREPEHRDVRQARHPLVHRAERHLRPPEPEDGRDARLPRAARQGAVRDHDDAEGPGLLRLARGQPHRGDQRPHRQGDRHPAADRGPGRAARVVGLEGPDLGQRVERGQGRPLRPGDAEVARVATCPARRRSTRSTSTTRTWSG